MTLRTASATKWKKLLTTLVIGIVFLVLHVGIGSAFNYSPIEVLKTFLGYTDSQTSFVIWSIRLPRAFGCIFAGGLLASAGSTYQAVFRNPLADPYILGTSSGAAIGGVLALILGVSTLLGGLLLPLFAFVTGMASLGVVLMLSYRRGKNISGTNLLLSGVLMGSILSAILSFALLASHQNANLLGWLLGSVDPMYWPRVAIMGIVLLVCGLRLQMKSRLLNVLATGEEAAARLGVDVQKSRRELLFLATAMTATAVGCTGVIGFVGLISPHISRRIFGMDWRFSLPGSAIIGAVVLLAADAISQRILMDGLPVGIVTAFLGAPVLLILLRQEESTTR